MASAAKRKQVPGHRCVVMFCNKTNADNVSLHQFPKDLKIQQKWVQFVSQKRDSKFWTHGSGYMYVCSDHFLPTDYDGYHAKLAGFASKLVLKKETYPTINPIPNPEQLQEATLVKLGSCKHWSSETDKTPRSRTTLTKIRAHRVSIFLFISWHYKPPVHGL